MHVTKINLEQMNPESPGGIQLRETSLAVAIATANGVNKTKLAHVLGLFFIRCFQTCDHSSLCGDDPQTWFELDHLCDLLMLSL